MKYVLSLPWMMRCVVDCRLRRLDSACACTNVLYCKVLTASYYSLCTKQFPSNLRIALNHKNVRALESFSFWYRFICIHILNFCFVFFFLIRSYTYTNIICLGYIIKIFWFFFVLLRLRLFLSCLLSVDFLSGVLEYCLCDVRGSAGKTYRACMLACSLPLPMLSSMLMEYLRQTICIV